MFTAEYAENAEIFHEIRLGALCALGGETRYHLLLDHYPVKISVVSAPLWCKIADQLNDCVRRMRATSLTV